MAEAVMTMLQLGFKGLAFRALATGGFHGIVKSSSLT